MIGETIEYLMWTPVLQDTVWHRPFLFQTCFSGGLIVQIFACHYKTCNCSLPFLYFWHPTFSIMLLIYWHAGLACKYLPLPVTSVSWFCNIGNAPIKTTALKHCYKQGILRNFPHSGGCLIGIRHGRTLRSSLSHPTFGFISPEFSSFPKTYQSTPCGFLNPGFVTNVRH